MDRRGFIGSILVACAAPAIVRADSLMRIVPVNTTILPAGTVSLKVTGAIDVASSENLAYLICTADRDYVPSGDGWRLLERNEWKSIWWNSESPPLKSVYPTR